MTYAVNDRTKIDIELKDIKQCFSFLSYADSVFGVKCCGNCESKNLSFCHRQPQGYDYYSVKCNDCKHELKFGQQKEGGKLFPKGWEEPYYNDNEDSERKPRGRSRDNDESEEREYEGAGANGHSSKNDDIPF